MLDGTLFHWRGLYRVNEELIFRPQQWSEKVGPEDLVCVTGSFFLAAEMRPLVPNERMKRLPAGVLHACGTVHSTLVTSPALPALANTP